MEQPEVLLDSGTQNENAGQVVDEPVETEEVNLTEEAGDAEEPSEEHEEIDYEGEKYKVPKVLKEAFLRQQDYTQKTQSLAEQRRAVEARQAEIQQEEQIRIQNFAEYSEAYSLDAQLKQFSQVNWADLIDSDPVQAMKLDRQMREIQQRRDQLLGSITEKQQQQALRKQQDIAKLTQEGRTVLERDIKGWSPEVAQQLSNYGQEAGFTAEDMSSVTDPRMVKVLHKAWQFDQLIKKQAVAEKPETQEKPITRISASKGIAAKNPSAMTDSEFRKWRQSQIAQRNR